MTPFRRGSGKVFSIYVPTRGGVVQRSTGTPDAKLARRMEAMCNALKDERAFDVLEAVADKKITLGDLFDAYTGKAIEALRVTLAGVRIESFVDGWLADAKRVSPAAWPDKERQVRVLIDGLTFVQELTPGTIRDRLNALDVSSGTARHYFYAWSSFCDYLVSHSALAANPMLSRALVPRPKKSAKRTRWEEAGTDQRIIARTPGAVRIALVVCAASGADRATPLDMRIRDVQLLLLGTEPDAKQGREHRVDLPGTKTRTRDRKGVRLEPWAAPILREWIKDKLPNAPLIEGVSTEMLSDHWRTAAAAERVQDYWLRDTRHSYGVRAILSGYPLWEVSRWLGHGNVATTADVYLQFDYEVARRIRDAHATADTTSKSDAPVLKLAKDA